MEQVGGRGMKTNVGMEGSIVINDVKNGGNNNVHNIQGKGDDVSAVEPSIEMDEMASSGGGTVAESGAKKKRKKRKAKEDEVEKDPAAPKRFKSSFIFFSMAKYKELKKKHGGQIMTRITSMVAQAWQSLEPSEREKFEQMSRQDKLRYEREIQCYPGKLIRRKKRKKRLGAPKRPMSAYFMFANKQRAQVRAANPQVSNGEISKILSGMWKEMPEDEQKQYREQEQSLRKIYIEKMDLWKKDNEKPTMKGKMNTASSVNQNASDKSEKEKDNHNKGPIDFSSDVDSDAGATERLLGVGSVSGADTNPNTDDISIAASALREVRGKPQQHYGVGSSDPSQHNEYNGILGVNSTSGMQPMLGKTGSVGQAGYKQMEMSVFPNNQYGYPVGGNTHAMIMAQHGGNFQQLPGSMPIAQQPKLSQPSSLAADVQNNGTWQQQRQQLDEAIDRAIETGERIVLRDRGMGNSNLNDNPGGNNLSF